jgi:penicillin amidase
MKSIVLPKTHRQFSVARDDNGVPHITGATWLDALAGLGYMHATDRGTQMFFGRSMASGRASEQIAAKPELLETDRFFRRVGLHRQLRDDVRELDDRIFSQLTAYCEGVNDAMKGIGRSLPMWAVNFPLAPWTQESILLVGKMLSFGGLAISQMQNERLLIELIHAGVNETLLKTMFAPRLDHVDFDLVRKIKMSNQLSDEAMELLIDLPRLAGSNAWAVSPNRSASGHALLASDPHLEVNRLPAIWYEAVLTWGEPREQYVMGATLPGCPLFAVARTPQLAWGVTYMKGDTIDYFIEDVRRGGESGWQYRRNETWRDFAARDEIIEQKGQAAERLRFFESPQGVLEGEPDQLGEGYQLALAWVGNSAGQGSAVSAWLNMVHAKSTREAMEVARTCLTPTLCWTIADRAGHIGLQSCGRFPIRGHNQIGLAPIPAWDEKNHWRGWIDTNRLPSLYDPPEGFLASANEEMNPKDLPMLVTQPLPDYRKRRVVERLQQLPAATLDDMQKLQYDFVSLQARELLQVFLPHLPESPLKERLSSWDCQYDPTSREASLFHRLYIHVMIEFLGTETGIGWRRMMYLSTRVGYSMMIVYTADRMILGPSIGEPYVRDLSAAIHRAAEKTIADPKADQPWSEVNSFHFADRYFGGQQVGRLLGYDSRRYPMPGNHATPFQGHVLQTATRESTFAPSYHFVTDLGTHEAWTNLPGGPSESRFSKWYKNDIARWFAGEYKKLDPKAR